jgi:hypothetical protein
MYWASVAETTSRAQTGPTCWSGASETMCSWAALVTTTSMAVMDRMCSGGTYKDYVFASGGDDVIHFGGDTAHDYAECGPGRDTDYVGASGEDDLFGCEIIVKPKK